MRDREKLYTLLYENLIRAAVNGRKPCTEPSPDIQLGDHAYPPFLPHMDVKLDLHEFSSNTRTDSTTLTQQLQFP